MAVPWWSVHVAFLVVNISASVNTIIARTAFAFDEPGKERVTPLNLAVGRSVIATCVVGLVWLAAHAKCACHRQGDDDDRLDFSSPPPLAVTTPMALGAAPPSKSPPKQWSLRNALEISGLGVLGIPANLLFFLNGVQRTDAVTSGAFACMTPAACFLISRVLGVDALTQLKLASVVLVVIGNNILIEIWTLWSSNAVSRTLEYYIGCLCFVGNVMAWSLYLVLQKPVLRRVERLDFLAGYYLSGTLAILVVAHVVDPRLLWHQLLSTEVLTRWSWYSICFSGFINATLAYYLVAFGIHHGGPVIASAWSSSQPVFVVLEATLWLGESMNVARAVGGVVVMFGILASVAAHAQDVKHRTAPIASYVPSELLCTEEAVHVEVVCELPVADARRSAP